LTRVYGKIRRPMQVGMSLVLAFGFLVRPANFEAILIHNHGDDGFHAHALTMEEVGNQEEQHDRLHDTEHQISHEEDDHGALSSEHRENCSPVLVIFGDVSITKTTVRTTAGDLQPADFHGTSNFISNVVSILGAGVHRDLPWNFCVEPPPCRGLSAILQSNHAILI
jgi:hypothetical protein